MAPYPFDRSHTSSYSPFRLPANTMKVSRQCHEAASKANRVLGMVHRRFKDLDKKSLFDHLQRLHQTTPGGWSMQYKHGAPKNCPYLKGDIEHLEKVQRRATKLLKVIIRTKTHKAQPYTPYKKATWRLDRSL